MGVGQNAKNTLKKGVFRDCLTPFFRNCWDWNHFSWKGVKCVHFAILHIFATFETKIRLYHRAGQKVNFWSTFFLEGARGWNHAESTQNLKISIFHSFWPELWFFRREFGKNNFSEKLLVCCSGERTVRVSAIKSGCYATIAEKVKLFSNAYFLLFKI